jgi:hypothetical protein
LAALGRTMIACCAVELGIGAGRTVFVFRLRIFRGRPRDLGVGEKASVIASLRRFFGGLPLFLFKGGLEDVDDDDDDFFFWLTSLMPMVLLMPRKKMMTMTMLTMLVAKAGTAIMEKATIIQRINPRDRACGPYQLRRAKSNVNTNLNQQQLHKSRL